MAQSQHRGTLMQPFRTGGLSLQQVGLHGSKQKVPVISGGGAMLLSVCCGSDALKRRSQQMLDGLLSNAPPPLLGHRDIQGVVQQP